MKEYLRELFRKLMGVISNFSPVLTSKIYYFVKIHKKLNLKDPKTFNEKLMYLKLNIPLLLVYVHNLYILYSLVM